MSNIPKLKEFTVEELQEQLKDKKIDKEFLIEYIVKRDKVYNQLIDEVTKLSIQVSSRETVVNELQQRIYIAVDKLYCCGEILDADFQQKMIRILKKGEPNNE